MKMEKLNGELRKFISLGRKISTLQIDPLPCEHPLKSSVPFRSGPFRSVPFSCERGLNFKLRIFGVNFRKIGAFKKNNRKTKNCVPEEAKSDYFVS